MTDSAISRSQQLSGKLGSTPLLMEMVPLSFYHIFNGHCESVKWGNCREAAVGR